MTINHTATLTRKLLVRACLVIAAAGLMMLACSAPTLQQDSPPSTVLDASKDASPKPEGQSADTEQAVPQIEPSPNPHTVNLPAINNQKPLEEEPFMGPLGVIITAPADSSTTADSMVVFTGRGEPDTVISIDEAITITTGDGTFSLPVTLVPGLNLLEVTASVSSGETQTVYFIITHEP
jgi:hypothetical protein